MSKPNADFTAQKLIIRRSMSQAEYQKAELRDKFIENVPGYTFKLQTPDGIWVEFGTVKDSKTGRWTLYEMTTGLRVRDNLSTRNDCVDQAREDLPAVATMYRRPPKWFTDARTAKNDFMIETTFN